MQSAQIFFVFVFVFIVHDEALNERRCTIFFYEEIFFGSVSFLKLKMRQMRFSRLDYIQFSTVYMEEKDRQLLTHFNVNIEWTGVIFGSMKPQTITQ